MAYDEGLASLMRESLENEPGYSEKKMFGGLCFLIYGNMVSGVHSGGGMFRVGKATRPRHGKSKERAQCFSPASRWAG